MRAVIQRVHKAAVAVAGRVTGSIGRGVLVFLGIRKGDGEKELRYVADKVLGLRIFPDADHAMNRSLRDLENPERTASDDNLASGESAASVSGGRPRGEILLVSQFTLYGDCRRGRRPSFDAAAAPADAEVVYRDFANYLCEQGFPPQEGVFGADMQVSIENDGPVTVLVDSEKAF